MNWFNAWLNRVFNTRRDHFASFTADISWQQTPSGLACAWDLPEGFRGLRSKPASIGQLWAYAGMATQGIRLYAPTRAEAEAFGEVDLRVPCSTYRQPFETFVVVLPDGSFPDAISPEHGRVRALIARLARIADHWLFAFESLCDGAITMRADYYWHSDATETIDAHILSAPAYDHPTSRERDVMTRCRRILMNACLLLTHAGAKPLGTAEPARESALRERIANGNRAQRRRAARELQTLPLLYGFDQQVRVYEQEGPPASSDHAGYEVKPHWRRGHWAHQAHGPGGSLRKLIFRPAVMVNAHRFGGEHADTRVTLTTSRTEDAA